MKEDDLISKGLFNEAGFVIRRLHKLQDRINTVRANLLAFNIEENCYNYQILFADLTSLMNEIWAKLTDEEQEQLVKLRDLIKDSLRLTAPHRTITRASNNTKQVVIVPKNWENIQSLLEIYEKLIKNAEDAHGFSNPDMEGGDLF